VAVEHLLYVEVIQKFVEEKKAGMNAHERLRYKLFRKVKGIPIGSKYSGVPLMKTFVERRGIYPKKSYNWGDMGMLHYKLDSLEDGQKQVFI